MPNDRGRGDDTLKEQMDRRRALKLGASGAVGLLTLGCVGRSRVSTVVRTEGGGHSTPPRSGLVPVRVSEDRIIRRVVGLRPFQPAGFLVGTERLGDKLVVHNYGHGGGGISLSWGTAHLAVEEAEARVAAGAGPRRAAVLGCGVVGLSTARLLQRRGWQVTIYARDLPPLTTSNVAGGQWSPTSVYDSADATPAFLDQFTRASRLAYREFQNLVGNEYGVSWVDNYFLSDNPPGTRPLYDLLPDVFANRETLEGDEHPFPSRYALRVTTMLIEPAIYLNALLRDARIAGAKVVVRELTDLAEVAALPEGVIVNCTGLGARALFGDQSLVPVKGQLTILQPQPEVDYLVLHRGLYMFPRADGILLGGTFERGEWSLDFNHDAERRIIAGHRDLFGGMRS